MRYNVDANKKSIITELQRLSSHFTELSIQKPFDSYKTGFEITAAQLKQILITIPESVTSLKLLEILTKRKYSEIIAILTAVPKSIRSLDLSQNNLSKLETVNKWSIPEESQFRHAKTFSNLIETMQAIPESITSLYLGGNLLGRTDLELFALLQTIKPTVTLLYLNDNNLDEKTADELIRAMQVIHPSVKTLDLSYNKLGKQKDAQLAAILQAIHSELSSLSLAGNNLSERTAAELIAAMKAIHPSVTTLNLANNNLGAINTNELITVIQAIKPSVKTLNLCRNSFIFRPALEVIEVIKAIPRRVTCLDLSDNDFCFMNEPELKAMIEALPPHLESLSLGSNSFSVAQLNAMFSTMPQSLTSLSLNLLNSGGSHNQFTEILEAIPASVTSIDLHANNLHYLSIEELKSAFAKLPAGISMIGLKTNGLSFKFSNSDLLEIIATFPNTVTKIELDEPLQFTTTQIKTMTAKQRRMLMSILAKVAVTITDDNQNILLAKDNPVAQSYYIKKLGHEVPSLLTTAAFFVAKHQADGTILKAHAEIFLDDETREMKDYFTPAA